MKDVSTKSLDSAKVLTVPVKQVHEHFCDDNNDVNLSFSYFAKMRPKCVKTIHEQRLYQSKCEYCENVKFEQTVQDIRYASVYY